ncbi:DNA repair protein RAD4 [Hyalella azteca]|uniref:DNA repair protein RAD4 n=1 Tax=Hyalella azteca TaxID=294128 RepID=A0A8B7P3A9_HYAAZ|nr:DNA repair protein RAD4 [Hyalella azteca]
MSHHPGTQSRAAGPVAYVTAYNADQSVKDVTRRYVAKWLSFENKLRCDSAWWQEVLAPYAPTFTAREKAENLQLEETLRQQPLPKTIAEYKDHPMFALQRHLLKFEAFYPPNPDPVGYVRGEAVYPRECVYTLHSRDIWKKDGKTVKVGEEPYKIVKARPKWDRALCQVIKDLPLEIFGPWQVEDYQPPVAKGGRVPRNEYGNVELFKKTMLPVGTVHLDARYEDLSRVARKLKIDCAPAMVGFDYHKGGTHPVYDGYVVCQEFKDVLLDAWTEEMQLKAKREEAKRLRRIYDNWKRLIQGILIKNHVREKYGQDSDHDEPSSSKNSKSKSNEKSLKPQKKMKQTDKVAVKSETEEKVRLGIDMSSDTVAMAKMSFKASLSSRGMVLQPKTAEDEALAAIEAKPEDLILDSDEETKETEEEKKEKLRKILAWNSSKLGSMANLSDDSDADENVGDEPDCGADKLSRGESTESSVASSRKVLTSESSDESDSRTAKKTRVSRTSQQVTKKNQHCKRLSLAGRNASKSKGRSTKSKENVAASDESNGKTLVPTHERRPKRQSTTRKNVDYKESEESDISLDESDVEDKTYKPESLFKPRQSNVALSEESD